MALVDDVRRQITERMKELKPLVDEYHQLEAMVQRLGDGTTPPPRADVPAGAVDHLAPPPAAGAGAHAAAAPAPRRRWRWCRPNRGSPSPRWARRWESPQTTCTAGCPSWPKTARSKRTAKAGNPPPSTPVAARKLAQTRRTTATGEIGLRLACAPWTSRRGGAITANAAAFASDSRRKCRRTRRADLSKTGATAGPAGGVSLLL